MKKRRDNDIRLSFDQLYDGYSKTVENGTRLFNADMALWSTYPEVALGLFELGQEEIGKSLTFLAGFSFLRGEANWIWFWSSWKDHQRKAHRAFLYELFSPLRVIVGPHEGVRLSGGPDKNKIKEEKEAAFYVGYDSKDNKFMAPQENVSTIEVANRSGTLLCLSTTAEAIKAILDQGDVNNNYIVFGELALRVCGENIYQQDMEGILKEFASRSPYHNELIADLKEGLRRVEETVIQTSDKDKKGEG